MIVTRVRGPLGTGKKLHHIPSTCLKRRWVERESRCGVRSHDFHSAHQWRTVPYASSWKRVSANQPIPTRSTLTLLALGRFAALLPLGTLLTPAISCYRSQRDWAPLRSTEQVRDPMTLTSTRPARAFWKHACDRWLGPARRPCRPDHQDVQSY